MSLKMIVTDKTKQPEVTKQYEFRLDEFGRYFGAEIYAVRNVVPCADIMIWTARRGPDFVMVIGKLDEEPASECGCLWVMRPDLLAMLPNA